MKWLEMRMVGDKDTMVYQMLTPGNPAEMDQIQEVVFKTGDKPAMKMSGAMIGMIRGQMGKNSALANLCEGVSLVGEESVTVPAGTLQSRSVSQRQARLGHVDGSGSAVLPGEVGREGSRDRAGEVG